MGYIVAEPGTNFLVGQKNEIARGLNLNISKLKILMNLGYPANKIQKGLYFYSIEKVNNWVCNDLEDLVGRSEF